jgi:hypothetical protein
MLCDGLANSPDFLKFPAFCLFCGRENVLNDTVCAEASLEILTAPPLAVARWIASGFACDVQERKKRMIRAKPTRSASTLGTLTFLSKRAHGRRTSAPMDSREYFARRWWMVSQGKPLARRAPLL